MGKKTKKKSKNYSSASQTRKWLIASGVFAFSFLIYVNTIGHGYVLDDDLVCNKNEYVQQGIGGLEDIFSHSWYHGFSGTAGRYYRPMMLAGFAIENTILGNEPSTFHSMNVFYYALSCSLLFLLMLLLFKERSMWFSLAVALMFAAHPLHVEVVANVKSRDEIFAFLGLLGVLFGIIKFNRKNKIAYFVLALSSYIFAILSKEAALAFVGIVPLTLYFFTEKSFRHISLQTVAFFIIAIIYFGIRAQIVDNDPSPFGMTDNSLFAIEGRMTQLSTAISMLGKYFGLLIFPHPLSFDYSFNQITAVGWGHWKVWTSLLISAFLAFVAIKGLKNKYPISYGIFVFALTFVITSNLVFLIGATFAERFMFIPIWGFSIVVSYLLFEQFPRIVRSKSILIKGSFIFLLLSYTFKTTTQNSIWESNETLFESGIKTSPNSSRTQSFFGVMNYQKALTTQNVAEKNRLLAVAVKYLKKSIETNPSFTETYQHLGTVYEAQNKNQLAIQTYQNGLITNSEYFPAMTNIGILLGRMKQYPQSISYLKNALNFAPNNATILRALGITYKESGQFDLAAEQFKKAHELRPEDITYLQDLVLLYRTSLNDIETAIFYDKQIKKLNGE